MKLIRSVTLFASPLLLLAACDDASSEDTAFGKHEPVEPTPREVAEVEGGPATVDELPFARSAPVDTPLPSAPPTLAEAEPVAEPVVEGEPAPPPSLIALESLAHDDEGVDYLAQGDELYEQGRFGEAITAYRHALFDQDQPVGWKKLGRAYLRAGQPERGATALEESLRQRENLGVRGQLARVYLEQGEVERAKVHAEAVVRRDDNARSQYLLGKVYMKGAMWKQAIDAFGRSLDHDPSNIWAHNNLGYSALQVGQDALAVTHLEHCLDLEPLKAFMLNNLGVAYERQGRGPEALAAFHYAGELREGYVNATLNQERVERGLSEEEVQLSLEILDDMKAPIVDSTVASAGDPQPPAGE